MENMKTMILEIKSIEEKVGKTNNKYYLVTTDKGKFSIFEEEIIKPLKICYADGKFAEVEVKDTGKFKNIKAFACAREKNQTPSVPVEEIKPDKFFEARSEKNKSMYVSYAKDVFITLFEQSTANDMKVSSKECMKLAIELTKQAIDAFE